MSNPPAYAAVHTFTHARACAVRSIRYLWWRYILYVATHMHIRSLYVYAPTRIRVARMCAHVYTRACVCVYMDIYLYIYATHTCISVRVIRKVPARHADGDFSCKFAYKIDVNFYKTIIATIYVTIILTKPDPGAGCAELLLTALPRNVFFSFFF